MLGATLGDALSAGTGVATAVCVGDGDATADGAEPVPAEPQAATTPITPIAARTARGAIIERLYTVEKSR